MDLLNNLKWKWKFFKDDWRFLKVLNSPFKPLRLHWYFGDIEKGMPYFLPRRTVNNKEKPGYLKFLPIKYFGFNWCSLGYKTKWSDTDYRHEWNPAFSFVIFGKQLWIGVSPKLDLDNNYVYSYWECWLIYEHHTDRKLSKVKRLMQCMKEYSGEFTSHNSEGETKGNYYNYILKNKYLKYVP